MSSLYPEDPQRKGRSRSRSRDRRSKDDRAPEHTNPYADVREPSYIYPEDDLEDRYKGRPDVQASGALPYPEEGGIYSMLPGDQALYSYDSQKSTYKTASPTADSHYRSAHDKDSGSGLLPGAFPEDEPRGKGKGKDDDPRVRYVEPRETYETRREDKYGTRRDDEYESRREDKYEGRRDDKHDSNREGKEDKLLKFLPSKYRDKLTGDNSRPSDHDAEKDKKERRTGKDKYDDDLAYGKPAVPKRPAPATDDLAYGKASDVPSASSYALTPYGATATEDKHDDKRDDRRGDDREKRRGEHDGSYDAKYYDMPDQKSYEKHDDRHYDKYDERYYEHYDEKYYDKKDEYRDDRKGEYRDDRKGEYRDDRKGEYRDERRDGRWDDRPDEKRTSKYAARDDSPDRRRPADIYEPRRYDGKDERAPLSPATDDPSSRKRGDSLGATYSSTANILTVEPGSRDTEGSRDRRHRREKSDARGSSDLLTVDSGHKRDKSKSRDKSRERSRDRRRDKSPGPDLLSVESSRRERSRSRDGRGSSSLTVDTGRVAGMSLASAPASPLLESYYGTYQAMSPMPSPLLLASKNPSDELRTLEPLSPIGSDLEGDGKKRGRRARFHDPGDITTQLAQALKGSKRPDTGPLIEILPGLTHEQVMELRLEYKKMVKTGSDRKGVNVAKHIRARLKDEDPLLMKACYAVALGMWESEAYWANFWYQGDKTRRELLIESLMGRTNEEIRLIKDAFSDKKYDNSLTKCMKTELKEDKFKKAVLMVLDERRMEEYDGYGRQLPINYDLVDHDVSELRRAVKSEKGGETAMILIVVQRSDSHLRAVLQEYERHHRSNFARDSLKKSGNLVGELLAHILNGVINRPVRDALLLHHALTASRKDGLRRELLISRLVRYHWDPQHMRAVKVAYRERYDKSLSDAVREATSGEWGLFCRELCIARTPDDVRRFDNVAVSRY